MEIVRVIASNMSWHRLTTHYRVGLLVLAVVGVIVILQPLIVTAGPITNGPGIAPFTKLGVYQGLATIAPPPTCVGGSNPYTSCPNTPVGSSLPDCFGGGICTASSVLEIGNAGRDIAGTGDIYLRPGGLTQGVGLRLQQQDNARVGLSVLGGKLCFGSPSATNCHGLWSDIVGGSGDVFWELYPSASPTAVRPSTGQPAATVRIGRPTNPVPNTNGVALEIYGSGSPVVRVDGSLTTGYNVYDLPTQTDINRGGNIFIDGNLAVTTDYFAYNGASKVHTSVNRYISTHWDQYGQLGTEGDIDADTFDSIQSTTFASYYCRGGTNPGTGCANSGLTGPNGALCLGGGKCQKNDFLVIKAAKPNDTRTTDRICLRVNNPKVCAGGAVGSNIGTKCTADGECTNGALCLPLCTSAVVTCPMNPVPAAGDPTGGFRCLGGQRDGLSCAVEGYGKSDCPDCTGPDCPASAKRCQGGPNSGAQCTNDGECGGAIGSCGYIFGAGQCSAFRCLNTTRPCQFASDCGPNGFGICQRGIVEEQTTISCGEVDCAARCRVAQACNGQVGACSVAGTTANYTNGVPLETNEAFNGCRPDGLGGWIQKCDCFVDQTLEYYSALPSGSGGLLCTQEFKIP